MNVLMTLFWIDAILLVSAGIGIVAWAKNCRDDERGFLKLCAAWWLLNALPFVWAYKAIRWLCSSAPVREPEGLDEIA